MAISIHVVRSIFTDVVTFFTFVYLSVIFVCCLGNGQLCYIQRNNDCSSGFFPIRIPISVPTPRGANAVSVLVHPFPRPQACVRVNLPTCR